MNQGERKEGKLPSTMTWLGTITKTIKANWRSVSSGPAPGSDLKDKKLI